MVDTDNDGITDSEERFQQVYVYELEDQDCVIDEISISMDGTGYLESNTTIESIMNEDMLCTEVVGLVGELFEIKTDSQFDKAVLSFKIDTESLENVAFDNLMFIWYDEENYKFVELDTMHDEYYTVLLIQTNYDMGRIDPISFVDVSTSNYFDYDKDCYRIRFAEKYIDNMRDNEKASVVTFDSSTDISDNKLYLKQSLQGIEDVSTFAGIHNGLSGEFYRFPKEVLHDEKVCKRVVFLIGPSEESAVWALEREYLLGNVILLLQLDGIMYSLIRSLTCLLFLAI